MEQRSTILFVENDAGVTERLIHDLGEWAAARDVRIICVASPDELFETLGADPEEAGILLIDSKVSESGTIDLLAEIRSRYPSIVPLLLTGYTEYSEIQRAMQVGVFSYILKPWKKSMLVSELEKARHVYLARKLDSASCEVFRTELELAGDFQRKHLRPQSLGNAYFSADVTYEPVPELYCGGDFYDIIPLEDGKAVLMIGEVSGHGVRSAFVTAIMKTIIAPECAAREAAGRFEPAELLEWLNNRLCDILSRIDGVVVSFLVCLADFSHRRLTFANAGHLPFYVVRDGQPLRLYAEGTGLGFMKHLSYRSETAALRAGDRIVMYTDGLLDIAAGGAAGETRNEAGEAEDVLAATLPRIGKGEEFNRALMEALGGRPGEVFPRDDLTLLSVLVR